MSGNQKSESEIRNVLFDLAIIYIFHTMCLVYKWSGRLSPRSVNDR